MSANKQLVLIAVTVAAITIPLLMGLVIKPSGAQYFEVRYVFDERTNLCFAGSRHGPGLVNVPCTDSVLQLARKTQQEKRHRTVEGHRGVRGPARGFAESAVGNQARVRHRGRSGDPCRFRTSR